MSFLPFGRPQPSSAEKIAAAETEMEMIGEMMTRYTALSAPDLDNRFADISPRGQTEPILRQKVHPP